MELSTINVTSSVGDYSVFVGIDLAVLLLQQVQQQQTSKVVLIQEAVLGNQTSNYRQHLASFDVAILEFVSSEELKSLSGANIVWNFFQEHKLDRHALVIVIGGGALCDLVGFAASTFKRGIKTIYVPTTLLSQADAAVGGKTALNYSKIKNLLGTFHPPQFVFADINFLRSLSRRDLSCGLAEIIKISLVTDAAFFHKINCQLALTYDLKQLAFLVHKAVALKANIVQHDEYESNQRKLLNFGHTAGHALEAIGLGTTEKLLHGEAVALGIMIESRISRLLGFLDDKSVIDIKRKLELAALPVSLPNNFESKAFMDNLSSDKKIHSSKLYWTLLQEIGKGFSSAEISADIINQALTLTR